MTATSNTPAFVSVDKDLRGAARGVWAPVIEAILDPNETVFISGPDAVRAKGSLVQAMRGRGKRLRSKTTTVNGDRGIVFWAEDKA